MTQKDVLEGQEKESQHTGKRVQAGGSQESVTWDRLPHVWTETLGGARC